MSCSGLGPYFLRAASTERRITDSTLLSRVPYTTGGQADAEVGSCTGQAGE